jgi:hypothetical protein
VKLSLSALLPCLFLAGAPAEVVLANRQAAELAKAYRAAVDRLNEEHARKPGKTLEPDLAKRLPRQASGALAKLLAAKGSPAVADALLASGEAALDLDSTGDFERIRKKLLEDAPEHARRLGTALSRPRFVLRGLGGLESAYLERFADVLDAVLAAYDEVFGFAEWSKVPGKKLRVRLHLEEKITRSPHFAPQHPFHSEIDFPVVDAKELRSPTRDGQFLFYGLCHELGHVIAMWGKTKDEEEDHHAWAHYTGVAIVEHLSKDGGSDLLRELKDARWRSLAGERERLAGTPPSLSGRDGVLSLLIKLHDAVGPKAIGAAINRLDREDRRLRVNRVRYYTFRALEEALLRTLDGAEEKRAAAAAIPGGP